MFEGVNGSDALGRIQRDELQHEIYCRARHRLYHLIRIDFPELWEGRSEFGDLANSRPFLFAGGAPKLKDFEDLVNLRIAYKQRPFFI
jgi:hypothetical protein